MFDLPTPQRSRRTCRPIVDDTDRSICYFRSDGEQLSRPGVRGAVASARDGHPALLRRGPALCGDRPIVAEAKVTRATLYRHFPSKDGLVVAYLQAVARAERAGVDDAVAGGLPAAGVLRDIAKSIAEVVRSARFRGCAFLNAVAEVPDPDHPVHQAVLAHREWFQRTVTDLLAQVGVTSPELAGRHFVMLRDGAMASGCLSDPAEVCETFVQGVEGILQVRIDSAST